MPLDLPADNDDVIDIEGIVDWLRSASIDTTDEASLRTAAPALRALANNRSFLGDLAVEELKRSYSDEEAVYLYTAQVMMLHMPKRREDNFFLRANIWPAESDPVVKAAGLGPFFYHRPHDHNFNFLTVGYFGPGYGSNYYEYDAADVAGYPGEAVPRLKFIRTSSLAEGDVMLYRAGIDVHDQLPPESLSVSLNIVENSARSRFTNQYAFDLEKSVITQIINISPAPAIFGAALQLGCGNGVDVMTNIAVDGVTPYLRFTARKALAALQADRDGYCDEMAKTLDDRSRMVREWGRRHIATLEGRD